MVSEHPAGGRAEQKGCAASERRAEYFGRMLGAYFGTLKLHELIRESDGKV